MNPADPQKALIACPACKNLLRVPIRAAGKQARCRHCSHKFALPTRLASLASPPAHAPIVGGSASSPPTTNPHTQDDFWDELAPQNLPQLQAPPAPTSAGTNPASTSTNELVKKARRDLRRSSIEQGKDGLWELVSGMIMITAGIIWLCTGLMFGVLFFYPPILIVIGFFVFVRGLFVLASRI